MIGPNHLYFPFISNAEELTRLQHLIRYTTLNYIKNAKLQSLVLGISGGIDSALCAALLSPVCQELGIPLIGRSITIETNKQDEINRSILVGNAFCHQFEHLDITETFLHNKKLLINFGNDHLSKMRQGNMKARMRMMVLYDLAQLFHGMVISTDNYTEYLTGFWTLHGDVGDYAPIMHLWKTEVYNLSKHLLPLLNEQQQVALQQCIDATPVDGLGISSCDTEQLGVSDYWEADKLFTDYFQGNTSLESHPLIKRFFLSDYKRSNPSSISREVLLS